MNNPKIDQAARLNHPLVKTGQNEDAQPARGATMRALVYGGPGQRAIEDKPKPTIQNATDAIVKITKTTICGTDLHILKGDLPTVAKGRVLGHEGAGIVDQTGESVSSFKRGDRVIISCISACGKCANCKKTMYSHCLNLDFAPPLDESVFGRTTLSLRVARGVGARGIDVRDTRPPYPQEPSPSVCFSTAWVVEPIAVAIGRQRATVEQGFGRRRGGSTTRASFGWPEAVGAPSVGAS